LGAPVLPGLDVRGANRMGGSATLATLAQNPCVHAGSMNPVVRYNATIQDTLSRKKPRFPQFSWGFVAISLFFTRFCLFLHGFDG
jgi:hypothetical protein